MSDEKAIERLLSAYNARVDAHDFEGWADCFAPDGLFHGAYGTWRVHDQWREFAAVVLQRSSLGVARHFITNLLVSVEGDRASARSFLMVVRTPPAGPPSIGLTGETVDALVRLDGRWRIQGRWVHVDGRNGPGHGLLENV